MTLDDLQGRVDALRRELEARRRAGRTILIVEDLDKPVPAASDPRALADAFVAHHGFTPLGDQWHEVDQAEAHTIVTRILTADLAYGSRIMPEEEAAELADAFFALCPDDSHFFANTRATPEFLGCWAPLTYATFDTGIISVSGTRMGMIWVEDED